MGAGKKKQKTTVLISNNSKDLKFQQPGFKKLIKIICRRFKISNATVSISIVNNAEIRKINKQFLGRSGTTDCISFDLSDDKKPSGTKVFDIAVNGQMAFRQAKLRGHSGEAELALYITHGLLHNIGFDDLHHKDAKKMHKIEDEILQQFGYGPVYNKRVKIK